MAERSLVVEVSGKIQEGTLLIGGKANSLNILTGAGFPVPRAFCVTVDAYNLFLKESGLENSIKSFDIFDNKIYKEIRERIEHAGIPEKLHKAIVGAYQTLGSLQVAVRSSAINEDGESQSFAGQYETFLHIEDEETLVESVKRCWGSFWTSYAHLYAERDNAPEQGHRLTTGIAVVIQEMIEADVAGVLFTKDPINGHNSRTVIDACWGLGEGVVSGKVTTDTYIVNSDTLTICERTIRSKTMMSGRSSDLKDGIQKVPPELVNKPTLSEGKAIELASKAEAIRRYYGKDLDIEWAIKDGSIWILQARPITVSGTKVDGKLYPDENETEDYIRENAMFSRLDVGEIVTGLMTPLGLSFCKFYQHHIHGPAVKTMGLLDIGNPKHYMGYMQGHVYLNISASAQLLTQCPPTRNMMKFTKRYASVGMDFTNYENPYGQPISGIKYLKSSLYWFGYQVHNLITASRAVKKMQRLLESETERFLRLEIQSMSLDDLNKELRRIDEYFLQSCAVYMPFFLQSFALYDLLSELCEKWLKDEGEGLQNRIKASMNNLRTIEVTRGICELTKKVDSSVALRKLFIETPLEDLIKALQQDRNGRSFWEFDITKFLRKFGSRGHEEFDLSLPRWNDDPSYILQIIKMYLVSDVQLETRLREINTKREKDTQKLLTKLPFKIQKVFRFVIGAYAVMAERREATRPTFIAETWFYRKIILEVMRRLNKQGIVRIEDLPYIDFNEFRDYVSGRKSAEKAFSGELIGKNRNKHLVNQRLQEPPLAIIGGYVPRWDNVKLSESIEQNNLIKGLGASPGIIIARARVITDLATQAEHFKQGEILVTRFTEASWTPLFLLAAGVVADIGSLLSHSSIVAREFGIPAIVNARNATQIINTGDLIYLDGDKGEIRIGERAV